MRGDGEPTSSALLIRVLLVAVWLTCVSQTVERRGDKVAAYSLYDQAAHLAPDNALVRYRRAKMLISMRRYKVRATWRGVFG